MPMTPRLIRIKPPTSQTEATEDAQPVGATLYRSYRPRIHATYSMATKVTANPK